jgi:alpha-methylacyl-CoA racemase
MSSQINIPTAVQQTRKGPLTGIKVIEFSGIGPGPFAGMLLADMGADVIRIDRHDAKQSVPADILSRGKRSAAFNLKDALDREAVLNLCDKADMLIEGFRPGVMERLGLGPDILLERNKGLVYGRMTGWGQFGPLAQAAGHDLNYIALTGALAAIGEAGQRPVPPLNLAGDFGGGTMYLIMGMLCALVERQTSGQGQVIDCAMTDGASSLMSIFYSRRAKGLWNLERGTNLVDGGAHFYATYECADGKFISIGAIEPQFYAQLRRITGLDDVVFDSQHDQKSWPEFSKAFALVFAKKTRAEWCTLLEGTDACFAPVLDLDEAQHHPHNKERKTIVTVDGITQPAPAPRLSRTPGAIQGPVPVVGADRDDIMQEWLGVK